MKIGESLPKKKIHELEFAGTKVRGSDQHAMTSCLDKSAFLIFHDPVEGKRFGYDVWEGEQADGSFHYTGMGVKGNQVLSRGNKGLLEAADAGRPIHFFRRPLPGVKREQGDPYTYEGLVTLGWPPYEVRRAPDEDGNERDVFVFKLLPVGKTGLEVENEELPTGIPVGEFANWIPPAAQTAAQSKQQTEPPTAELVENQLHGRFGEFLTSLGFKPESVAISLQGLKGALRPDFVLRDVGFVIEAKASSSREDVRLAIGQVLDYRYLLDLMDVKCKPAILLPQGPTPDLVDLLKTLNVALIVERSDGTFDLPWV